MSRFPTMLDLAILACCIAMPAQAANVHKWIDEDGLTHYSDEPPDSVETTLIEVPDPLEAVGGETEQAPEGDYYSIANQWQRMHRERIERERIAVEKARLKAAQPPPRAPQTVYVDSDSDARYIPLYRGYGWRRHSQRHRHRHFFRHPAIQPYRPAAGLSGGFPTL